VVVGPGGARLVGSVAVGVSAEFANQRVGERRGRAALTAASHPTAHGGHIMYIGIGAIVLIIILILLLT